MDIEKAVFAAMHDNTEPMGIPGSSSPTGWRRNNAADRADMVPAPQTRALRDLQPTPTPAFGKRFQKMFATGVLPASIMTGTSVGMQLALFPGTFWWARGYRGGRYADESPRRLIRIEPSRSTGRVTP